MTDGQKAIDQLAELANEDAGTSAEAPSTSAAPEAQADLDAIVQRIAAENDKRMQGFQSLLDRKMGDLTRTFQNQLKTVGLSQEEREQVEQESEAEEIQRIRQENTLLKLRKDKPDAVDFFMEVMSQGSLEDQLAVIESKLGPKAAAQVEAAVAAADAKPTAETPVVNNPAREKSAGNISSALQGAEMTDELADAVLASGSKGMLSRLWRGQES